jgi:type III secretion protein U
MSEKTEAPTARRLRQVRRQGDSAVSTPLGQSIGFVVVLAVLPAFLLSVATGAGAALRAAIETGRADLAEAAWLWLALSAPVLGAAAAVSVVLGLVQTGGAFTASRFAPDFSRIDPFQGAKNLLSWGCCLAPSTTSSCAAPGCSATA